MKNGILIFLGLVASILFFSAPCALAAKRHVWYVVSPDHGQTFSYGTEQSRVWSTWGRNRHLALQLNYTNDPFVSRTEPREYDNFIFNFPNVLLGKEGRVFYLHTQDGRNIPVAAKQDAFLGTEIKLLPNAELQIKKLHGYLTVTIMILYEI